MNVKNRMLILALLFTIHTRAQDGPKSLLVVKPSLNLGNIAIKRDGGDPSAADVRVGYGIGLQFMQFFGERVYFTLGGDLNSRGYKGTRVVYLDAPVAMNIMLGKHKIFGFGGGAYAGMALSGKYKSTGGWTKFKFGETATDNRSRTDYGFLVNLIYQSPGLFFATFTMMSGLKDITPADKQQDLNWMRLKTSQMSIVLPLSLFIKGKK
jgi:hypothetical protein